MSRRRNGGGGGTRSFVALPLPDPIRDAIAGIQADLPVGRPAAPETLHLTLLFAGGLDDVALDELHLALAAVRAPGFGLRLEGLGSFGGDRTRSLWIGAAPEPRLDALQLRVAAAARQAGLRLPARRFVPHVTIARLRTRDGAGDAFERFVAGHVGLALPAVDIGAFALYASYLHADGPVHEELAVYPLEPRPDGRGGPPAAGA